MTTATKPPASPASPQAAPPADPRAVLTAQAGHDFQAMLKNLQAQSRQAADASAQLSRLIAQQQDAVLHRYRVFQLDATKRFMVLRDVEELTGAKCVFSPAASSTAFGDALRWVNRRIVDAPAHRLPHAQQTSRSPQPARPVRRSA